MYLVKIILIIKTYSDSISSVTQFVLVFIQLYLFATSPDVVFFNRNDLNTA